MLPKPFEPVFGAHHRLERHRMGLAAASVGGLVEVAPLFTIGETVEEAPDMRPHAPLDRAARDVHMREGCHACRSQTIRALRDEVERYGPHSLAVGSQYDQPMLWGSKRTGPGLARQGGKWSDDWQVARLVDPRALVPQSVMPSYAFLPEAPLEVESLPGRLAALRDVGVPHSDEQVASAARDAVGQARPDIEGADGVVERRGGAVRARRRRCAASTGATRP